MLPTMYLHWGIGWAFYQYFQNLWVSAIVAAVVVSLGMMFGAFCAFNISKTAG